MSCGYVICPGHPPDQRQSWGSERVQLVSGPMLLPPPQGTKFRITVLASTGCRDELALSHTHVETWPLTHIFAYLKLPHGLYPKGFWARMEEQTRSRLGEKSRKMLKETKGWAISHSVTDVTNIRKLVQCARHHVGQKNRTVTVAQPRLPRCTGQWGSQKHKQVINSTVMREMQW